MHANFHVTLAFALPILKSSMNNYIDRFAFGKGWKNEETNLTQSRVTRSQFLVPSSRRCLYTAVEQLAA